MSIQDSLQQLKDLKEVIRNIQMEVVKHFVTIASGLLGLLISLTPSLQHNRWLFLSILSFLLLCILFGSIVLYILLVQFRTMDKELLESIKRQMKNQKATFEPVFSKMNTLLKISETICILSFVLSFVLLVVFAFLKFSS